MSLHYDRTGRPITFDEWGRLFEDRSYQSLEKTYLPDGVWVSTVWLGIDHSFGDAEPVIFETMVFGGPHDQDCRRYTSEAEAYAGHTVIVASLRIEAETRS